MRQKFTVILELRQLPYHIKIGQFRQDREERLNLYDTEIIVKLLLF